MRAALLASMLIAGCSITPEHASRMDNIQLCHAYSRGGDAVATAELERRAFLTQEEWTAIRNKRVFVGMSEAAAICSWGLPSSPYSATNRTVTAGGQSIQYVYRMCGGCRAQYLYIRSGKVTATQ